ncbi:MAG: LURP-one-related family protein [Clostridia bacterium]|nr:LURP-one-related family protein [Clostridia bacterium]
MKVFIKNKIFTIGGSSEILDENQQPLYKVKGKIFSPTKKKLIYDKEGKLIYIVRNKFWKMFVHKALILDANKNKIATVKEKYLSLRGVYYIEDYPEEIKIEGKFFSFESAILKNGEPCAKIRRQLSLFRDRFSLEAEEKDIPFLCALTIAIDNITDRKRKED